MEYLLVLILDGVWKLLVLLLEVLDVGFYELFLCFGKLYELFPLILINPNSFF
jgi:hypothetical protein